MNINTHAQCVAAPPSFLLQKFPVFTQEVKVIGIITQLSVYVMTFSETEDPRIV